MYLPCLLPQYLCRRFIKWLVRRYHFLNRLPQDHRIAGHARVSAKPAGREKVPFSESFTAGRLPQDRRIAGHARASGKCTLHRNLRRDSADPKVPSFPSFRGAPSVSAP